LVEGGRSIRYAANAIGAPLTTDHRAVRRFQLSRDRSVHKKTWIWSKKSNDRCLNNNGVPLFFADIIFYDDLVKFTEPV
jgi:hypothetical protein